jgi:hypothetical protein
VLARDPQTEGERWSVANRCAWLCRRSDVDAGKKTAKSLTIWGHSTGTSLRKIAEALNKPLEVTDVRKATESFTPETLRERVEEIRGPIRMKIGLFPTETNAAVIDLSIKTI